MVNTIQAYSDNIRTIDIKVCFHRWPQTEPIGPLRGIRQHGVSNLGLGLGLLMMITHLLSLLTPSHLELGNITILSYIVILKCHDN